jgi:hypothetical protein
MRAKTSILIAALCFTLFTSVIALPQSKTQSSNASVNLAKGAGTALLESSVRREGLQFYFEIRNGGIAELARAANSLGPVTKLMASGQMKAASADLMGFVAGHFGALANARLALVGYGANGMAALIEAASDSDAQQLKAGIAQLLGANKTAAKAGAKAAEMDVDVRDRLVVAGSRAIVSMLTEASNASVIANDQEFMNARARFSDDPFFAYVDLASIPLGLPGGDASSAAYTAGALAALNSRPYAIAMGGSLEGDSVTVRALVFYNTNQSAGALAGLFSSVASSVSAGQPVAANFAAADADLFVDVMIDWEKLYETIESVFGMMAGAQANAEALPGGAQGANLFAMVEASLGFSIKNDLLPTLGNELAVSLSGFDRFFAPALRAASNGQRASAMPLPRFMLMIGLKDRVEFEKLIGRIFNKASSASAQLARTSYRGATISYSKDIAYTISGGFFILSGSPSDIRRALDARAMGNSLAATAEYRAAVGSSQQAMMQAYLSPSISSKLYELVSAEVAKSNSGLKDYVRSAAQSRSAIGVTMMPDADGLMMEMRVPTNLTFLALAAMTTGKPASYGIMSAPVSGIGIPNPTTPAAGTRNADGRRVPKMTNDDVMGRRP